MRVLLQRVSEASVTVDGAIVGAIGRGYLLLIGVGQGDTAKEADWLADKVVGLRLFADAEGKMNLALGDVGGSVLAVSQFTLYADCARGRRPSFVGAAPPDQGKALYESFVAAVRSCGVTVATGIFQADMAVALVNDGPVTIMLEREATVH
ncbi:MAG: D-tyrosyl-tRNA(Tyr) deacylase [Candidatus Sericytochromatia bacterium]|nr:D-tyrosyl-tRNA(Tyr) deacylase [Candidatus Sericytochromatia bacterium]